MDRPIVFEPLSGEVRVPERSTAHSAGYDVRAYLRGRKVRVFREAEGRVVEVLPSAGDGGAGPDDGPGAGKGGAGPRESAEAGPRQDGEGAGAGEGGGAGTPFLLLQPGDRALVPTGFRARLPPGIEGQLRIRSSVAFRKGLVVPNAPGTIDADYPEEWFVLVKNASARPQRLEHGERIAQVVLNRYEVLPWREGRVEVTTDRAGGFGSTGR